MRIPELSKTTNLGEGDLFPLWQRQNNDTRAINAGTLISEMQKRLDFPSYPENNAENAALAVSENEAGSLVILGNGFYIVDPTASVANGDPYDGLKNPVFDRIFDTFSQSVADQVIATYGADGAHFYPSGAFMKTDSTAITASGAPLDGADWANVGIGIAPISGSRLLVRGQDIDVNTGGVAMDGSMIQFQRLAKKGVRSGNPKALRVYMEQADGADLNARPWAISAEVYSYNNSAGTSGEAGTALSGVHFKYGNATGMVAFAAHIQAKDFTGGATTGGLIGCELNIQANGPDSNSNRIGLDIIARTNADVVGGANGEFHAGIRLRNSGSGSGKWNNAILIDDSASVQAILRGIRINTSQGTGGRGILDEGVKDVGIEMAGVYAAAIEIPADQKYSFGFKSTARLTMGYETADTKIHMRVGSADLVAFPTASTQTLWSIGGFETTNLKPIRLGVNGANNIFFRYNDATDQIQFYKGTLLVGYINMAVSGGQMN